MIEITIPGELRGKGRPRFDRRSGRAYTPAATVSAENWIKACAVQAYRGAPLEGPLDLRLTIGVPVPRSWSKRARADALAGRTMPTKKPDASNQLKLIEDALNGIVWVDDCQIVDGGFSKRYVEAPQTVLTVRRLP